MIWNIFFSTKLSFPGYRLFPLQICSRCIKNHIWYWTDSLEKLFCKNLCLMYFEEWLQFLWNGNENSIFVFAQKVKSILKKKMIFFLFGKSIVPLSENKTGQTDRQSKVKTNYIPKEWKYKLLAKSINFLCMKVIRT